MRYTDKENITGAEALLASLINQGVDTVFGYPGGSITPVYDRLQDYPELRHLLTRHEQGAVHAAQGYARVSNKTGVCMATSGPGATNLLTGIADAMLDSTPVVCISAQVPSTALGTDFFQEADMINMTVPITKWNYQITRFEEMVPTIAKAFYIARAGRPGPVYIEVTKDALTARGDYHWKPCTGSIWRAGIPTSAGIPASSLKPLACLCAAARWDNPLSRSHGFRTFFQKRKSPYCHKRQHGLFSWADTPGWTGSPLQFQIKAAAFPGDFNGGHPALFCDGSGIHPVSPRRDLGQVQHTGRIGKTGVGIQGESSVDIKFLLVCVLKLHKHIGGWLPVPGQSQTHPTFGFRIAGIEVGLVDLQLKGRDCVLPGEGDPLGGIGLGSVCCPLGHPDFQLPGQAFRHLSP